MTECRPTRPVLFLGPTFNTKKFPVLAIRFLARVCFSFFFGLQDDHKALARKISAQSTVLAKNDGAATSTSLLLFLFWLRSFPRHRARRVAHFTNFNIYLTYIYASARPCSWVVAVLFRFVVATDPFTNSPIQAGCSRSRRGSLSR